MNMCHLVGYAYEIGYKGVEKFETIRENDLILQLNISVIVNVAVSGFSNKQSKCLWWLQNYTLYRRHEMEIHPI